MGFITGMITGVAVAAITAAWYLSRAGERIRTQYRVEDRLAELGDELEARTRGIQAALDAQLAELRGASSGVPAPAVDAEQVADAALDPVAASAAETEAAAAAAAETTRKRTRKPSAPAGE